MRELIMWNLITLDGYFEGPRPWDLEFLEYAWGEELERFSLEQGREVGALLFGRVTYEGMAAHWTTATGEIADFMNTVPKYVFSRTLESADWNNTTLVKGDPAEEVARLKEAPGKDLFVFGSADLSTALIRHGLYDEYRGGRGLSRQWQIAAGPGARGGRVQCRRSRMRCGRSGGIVLAAFVGFLVHP